MKNPKQTNKKDCNLDKKNTDRLLANPEGASLYKAPANSVGTNSNTGGEKTELAGAGFLGGFVLPGLPHILLAADQKPEWQRVRSAFDKVKLELDQLKPDLLIIYSTYWASILGHQIQARENLKWTHVDDQFHELGSIPYEFKMDKAFAASYQKAGAARGLSLRTTDYEGFPVDTGSVVALKLLNPDNKIPVVIVSSNIYSDRAETVLLGKAARETVLATGRRAVAITITSLSNRLELKSPLKRSKEATSKNTAAKESESISSLKDEEWNQKMLEFFAEGRLEDVAQLSRQFHKEARVKKVTNFKPFWWLSAAMGASNNYQGKVYAYQPMVGTGAAVIGLFPAAALSTNLEYDEEDVEIYSGDRAVLEEVDMMNSSMASHPLSGNKDTVSRGPA